MTPTLISPGLTVRRLLTCAALTAATCLPTAGAAAIWAGASVGTADFGVHAGVALLPIPLLGTLGVEAAAGRSYAGDTTGNSLGINRVAGGLTLRDLNLPFTAVDAFATLGAEYIGGVTGVRPYAEAGLRGPLLGPAGWRAYVRGNTAGQFSGGAGLELRF